MKKPVPKLIEKCWSEDEVVRRLPHLCCNAVIERDTEAVGITPRCCLPSARGWAIALEGAVSWLTLAAAEKTLISFQLLQDPESSCILFISRRINLQRGSLEKGERLWAAGVNLHLNLDVNFTTSVEGLGSENGSHFP